MGDGTAMCLLAHSYRPDLVDVADLEQVRGDARFPHLHVLRESWNIVTLWLHSVCNDSNFTHYITILTLLIASPFRYDLTHCVICVALLIAGLLS